MVKVNPGFSLGGVKIPGSAGVFEGVRPGGERVAIVVGAGEKRNASQEESVGRTQIRTAGQVVRAAREKYGEGAPISVLGGEAELAQAAERRRDTGKVVREQRLARPVFRAAESASYNYDDGVINRTSRGGGAPGFESRVRGVIGREENLGRASDWVYGKLGLGEVKREGYAPGLFGRAAFEVVETGKAVGRFPFEFAKMPVTVGGRAGLFAESFFTGKERGELWGALKETPMAVVRSVNPFTPSGRVGLGLGVVGVRGVAARLAPKTVSVGGVVQSPVVSSVGRTLVVSRSVKGFGRGVRVSYGRSLLEKVYGSDAPVVGRGFLKVNGLRGGWAGTRDFVSGYVRSGGKDVVVLQRGGVVVSKTFSRRSGRLLGVRSAVAREPFVAGFGRPGRATVKAIDLPNLKARAVYEVRVGRSRSSEFVGLRRVSEESRVLGAARTRQFDFSSPRVSQRVVYPDFRSVDVVPSKIRYVRKPFYEPNVYGTDVVVGRWGLQQSSFGVREPGLVRGTSGRSVGEVHYVYGSSFRPVQAVSRVFGKMLVSRRGGLQTGFSRFDVGAPNRVGVGVGLRGFSGEAFSGVVGGRVGVKPLFSVGLRGAQSLRVGAVVKSQSVVRSVSRSDLVSRVGVRSVVGVRARQGEVTAPWVRVRAGQAQLPRVVTRSVARSVMSGGVGTPLGGSVPFFVVNPPVPPPPPGGFDFGRMPSFGVKGGVKVAKSVFGGRYMPSLEAVALGIRGGRPGRFAVASGLVLRPLAR